MKVNVPRFFAAYGPAGHPRASVVLVGTKEDIDHRLFSFLERNSGQGNIPTVFFDNWTSPDAQGYHVLEVVNGEISDEAIAALPVPECYAPVPANFVGRTLKDFRAQLPRFINLKIFEVWDAGDSSCGHDFGLEGITLQYKLDLGGVVDSSEVGPDTGEGIYFYASKCSNPLCNAVHAYPEQDS